ncbi:GrpB family protein [Enorma phocaeensis]|uniref:GrpB family protein n=1 Tax=Enorma phocaeensis TaxID=1871019 RepID=A0A921IWK2_9ACTN|nr:GrpB family protein [Enorma phocaeensis]HJG37841.1 GrpB family protein [Enorma phocaeensis]
MPQHITVVDYDPMWPQAFEAERALLAEALGDNCTAIYHIGSTAVPCLAAKPIIDLMVAVRSLHEVDSAATTLCNLGYEYLGEFGIPGRRYLRKGGDERTHQVHIFAADDWYNIDRHLAVRDFLRNNRQAREAYANIKRDLAQRYPYDIDGYCAGKGEYVRELERQALAVYDGSRNKPHPAAPTAQQGKPSSASAPSCSPERYTGIEPCGR